MTVLLIRERKGRFQTTDMNTQRENYVKIEEATGVMHLWATQCHGLPESEARREAWIASPSDSPEGITVNTLISNLWPPERGGNKSVLF